MLMVGFYPSLDSCSSGSLRCECRSGGIREPLSGVPDVVVRDRVSGAVTRVSRFDAHRHRGSVRTWRPQWRDLLLARARDGRWLHDVREREFDGVLDLRDAARGPDRHGGESAGGPLAGGTAFTITGTNFVAGSTSVTIGGTPATSVNVTSPTSLAAMTPAAGTAGARTWRSPRRAARPRWPTASRTTPPRRSRPSRRLAAPPLAAPRSR